MWAIGAFCGVARWLEFVAIAIFAYELTHSPELVALLAVLRMLPYVLLGFSMGALADAIDRKSLLIASLLVMALVSGAMALLTVSGFAGYALVAVATMASGAFWTTDMPVRRRLLVDAVAKDRIAAALGFDNSTMYATRALGPVIGGTTYQLLGIDGIYALITVSYLICVFLGSRLMAGLSEAPAVKAAGSRFGLLLPPRELIEPPFPDRYGRNACLQPMVLSLHHHGSGHRAEGLRLGADLCGRMSACEGIGGMFGALIVAWLASEEPVSVLLPGHALLLILVAALSLHLTVATAAATLYCPG